MKKRYKILSFLILILVGCNSQQNKETVTEKRICTDSSISKNSTINNSQAEIDSNIIKIIDSLRIDDAIKNKEYFIYACEHLFDFKSLQFEMKNLTTDFLKSNVTIKAFNDNFLITINYEQWSKNGNSIKLFLYDKQLKKLGKGIIMGCHYNNGEIKIIDWNNDSIDEIRYRIDMPTQSVAYIEHMEDIYRFSKSFNFEKIFSISLETRDCSPTSGEKGEITERNYQFLNPQEIKVTEVAYTIDCENFEWHDKITKKQKLNSNEYLMVWNDNKKKFEKQQAGNKL